METLIKSIELDKTSNTLMNLIEKLGHVQKLVENVPGTLKNLSIKSGTELLVKFTTRMALDIIQEESDFDKVKQTLIHRYIMRVSKCRSRFDIKCPPTHNLRTLFLVR